MKLKALCWAALAGAAFDVRPTAAEAGLVDVLGRELRRNFDVLRKESQPPYFLSYAVYDVRSARIGASFGALTVRGENRSRTVDVEVRVGDYALDSTRRIRGDMMS